MRSLYVAILVAMLAILSLSVVAFFLISAEIERNHFNPVFDAMDEVEVQDARHLFENGGPTELAKYLHQLDTVFGGAHYLLDANGKDVMTGEDRSWLLPKDGAAKWRGHLRGKAIVTHSSADGKYWFTAVSPAQFRNAPFYRYYLLVVAASLVLCWLAAIRVVSPIRRIAATIERFGHGELTARVDMKRRDEIGVLGNSFNRMAERLERMIVTEHRLLEDISHELRSPLARLNFSIKLARTASDRDAALDRVKRDVDRLTTLVSGLVEMTRVEGDPQSRKSEPVCMMKIVQDTLRDASLEMEARGCNVQVEGTLRGKVLGDAELLRRAVENVLRNAVRYSPPNAYIDVELREADEKATIAIRDYGSGIPGGFLGRIFDPFFRVEEARDSETGGMGLGLSISKRAIQLHNGTIEAENANPGLRVRIVLPVQNCSSITEHDRNIEEPVEEFKKT